MFDFIIDSIGVYWVDGSGGGTSWTAANLNAREMRIAAGTTGNTSQAAPFNIVCPSISGGLTTGSVLIGDPGAWMGMPTLTLIGRWLRNGIAIGGATASIYSLVSADEGQNIIYEVIGTNGVGNFAIVVSLLVILTASGALWTLLVGFSIPESWILIGPNDIYIGVSIDTGIAQSRNVDLQSTSDVSGTFSFEISID